MKHLLIILLALLPILPASGKNKERITERGSSLFYRSWRYPVVTDEKVDTTETIKMPADSVPAVDSSLQDSVAAPDSIPQDSLPQEPLANVGDSLDRVGASSLTDDTKEGGDGENGELADMPKVTRPDINTCIVYFIFDQNNFITDYSAEFDTIMAFIDYHQGKDFEVVGHTDERGTVVYNQGLSERRAKRVYDVLVRRGVDPKRLTMIGRSELELAIPHAKNEREHLLNRRVVVRVKKK